MKNTLRDRFKIGQVYTQGMIEEFALANGFETTYADAGSNDGIEEITIDTPEGDAPLWQFQLRGCGLDWQLVWMDDDIPEALTDDDYREQARQAYAVGSDDDIEIDSDAKVSPNDEGGAWVAAWVYVRNEDVREIADAGVGTEEAGEPMGIASEYADTFKNSEEIDEEADEIAEK